MFIRTTRFQVKQSKISKFPELVDFARERVGALDGLLENYLAMDDSGSGVMVGVWESKAKADVNSSAIKANWAAAMENMDGQPQVSEFVHVAKLKG